MPTKPGKLTGIIQIILILSILIGGCGPGGPMAPSSGKTLQSQVKRQQEVNLPPGDLAQVVQGNNAFALDFYQAARSKAGNQFFSPYSLSTVLAMTFGGARRQTAEQMARTLHYDLPPERLHPAFNYLDQQLDASGAKVAKDATPFQLDVANSIWGQQGHPFKMEYLDLLALHYGAGLRLADFVQDADSARQEINRWVEERTKERIKNLIPAGGVNVDTRLVLVNAIYFKADWLHPFDHGLTRDQPFTLLDGSQVQVPTMNFDRPQNLSFFEGETFQAVELPYVGGQASMIILAPESGNLEAFEAGLDAEKLAQILSSMQSQRVTLFMPRFEYTAEYQLSETLKEMGMPDAFCDGNSDFSAMDEDGNLCIDQVFHKAFVKVDEKGTEAAAASAVVMMESSAMIDEPVLLRIDRPFIFLIRHNSSGSILFAGRVLDPRL